MGMVILKNAVCWAVESTVLFAENFFWSLK